MKKPILIFLILQTNIIFAQQNKENNSATTIEIPSDFFDFMFRKPNDVYIVAWHGGAKVAEVISSDNKKVVNSDITPFVDRLNDGLTSVYDSYFEWSMKDEMQQIVSPEKKVWYARCGLKSENNINISPVTGKEIKGFPGDIKSDIQSKDFFFKRSFTDPETKKRVVVSYRIEATSIYFSHDKATGLTGEIKRADGYKFCGRLMFNRLGPGNKTCLESVEVKDATYEFKDLLYRGDYKVFFLWPGGSEMQLDYDFVYNPTDKDMPSDFTIEMYEGEISGKVRYKKSERFAADYPVKLEPICSESGLPEMETTTDKDGNYTFKNVPQGEYHIVVKGGENEDALLIDKDKLKIKPKDSEISFIYDIFVTYHAPGFAHVELVWEKAKIRFPEEGDEMQIFDRTAYIQSGGNGQNPTGTNGKPLDIPFAMNVPGIGKITNYGASQNNMPKVISIYSLGAYEGHARFKIMESEEALNMCEMTQRADGPVYLDLSFDLFAGGPNAGTDWIQHTVGCIEDKIISDRDKTSIINRSPYPTAFKQLTITEAEIKSFKEFKEFEKTVSNGRATLKIEFKVLEENSL